MRGLWCVVVVLLLLLGGCRSVKYVPVETVKTDSLYLTVHERDSIHVKDSVHIKEKGDTVMVDRWHTVYRDRTIRDTVYKEREKVVEVPFPVEKELTWWESVKINIGELSIGIIIIMLIVIVLLIRKGGKR